jgi:hypothetical protein
MTTVDAFLTNCRLADGHLVDICIAEGMSAKARRRPCRTARERSTLAAICVASRGLQGLSAGERWIRTLGPP